MTEIAEKKVISSNAICGAYYFSKPEIFMDAILELLIYGIKTGNEYYMSQVCRKAIKDGACGGIFMADKNDIVCMGTPDQLQEALKVIK